MNIGSIVIKWYQTNGRELPWRTSKDPYTIWVSEIIMQQTRINQGLPYYNRFMAKFPDIFTLANANENDIMLAWQGLGYYSRARNMHTTAKFIANELNGCFPKKASELIKLKGIGKYTSAAIASFCFNENIAAIDGNVVRVITRLYNVIEPVNIPSTLKKIEEISASIIKNVNANDYNQAMMDFGSCICTPRQPNCFECILNSTCLALINNTINQIPAKIKKKKITDRYFIYLVITNGNNVLIRERTNNDIWQGLNEFVLIKLSAKTSLPNILNINSVKQIVSQISNPTISINQAKPHKLSHQTIHAYFIKINCSNLPKLNGYKSVNIDELKNIALPKLIDNYIVQNLS